MAVQPPVDDESLARRARDGDEAAFATLVERYQRSIFNFAYRLLGNVDDAADASQLGFVQLYAALQALDLTHPIRPWLYRTVRNRCIDLIRQRRTVSLSEPAAGDEEEALPARQEQLADPTPLPEELAERADLQHLLTAAIARLPARYREVVALRYMTDFTFGEVAEALGIPENTAKIHFHRAKALLRETLRELI